MYFEITGQNSPTAKTVVLSAGLAAVVAFGSPS
ncbi:putative hydrolase [Yersinia enterocolitica]|nr:putative hydrolase [Yersinia enterocolitica]